MSERRYLTRDELEFADDDRVRSLGDDRYVVATGDGADDARVDSEEAATADDVRADGAAATRRGETADGDGTRRNSEPDPEAWGPQRRGRYVVDLRVRTDEGADAARFDGEDIREVFERALRWYARRVSPDDDPRTVLDVLLAGTEFDRRATDRVPDR
jgi:hypothetical protein